MAPALRAVSAERLAKTDVEAMWIGLERKELVHTDILETGLGEERWHPPPQPAVDGRRI
jgi:hypothetical protein